MEAAEGGAWIWRSECFREYERVRFAVSGLSSEYVCTLHTFFLVFLFDYLPRYSSRVGIEVVSCTSLERNWGSSPRQLTHNLT